MEAWQERVLQEHEELNTRIDRLITFISREHFIELAYPQRELLVKQLRAMLEYKFILKERVRSFSHA